MWECVKKNPTYCHIGLSAPYDGFLIGFGFIPSSPQPPPPSLTMLWPKEDLKLLGVGGEGLVVLLISLERLQHF